MSMMPSIRLPRSRLLTPEINTYAHQMQQCQSRSAKLPFQTQEGNVGELQNTRRDCNQHANNYTGVQQNNYSLAIPGQNDRRSSYYSSSVSRKSSFLLSRRHSKSNSFSTHNSSRKPSLGLRDPEIFPPVHQESALKNRNGFFRVDQDKSVKNGGLKAVTGDKTTLNHNGEYDGTVPQGRNLREAKVVSAIHPHQEYLLHALTALAINSLTSEMTPGDESEKRLAAVTQLSHNTTNKTKSPSEVDESQNNHIRIQVSKSATSGSYSDTSKLDEFFAAMEETAQRVVTNEDIEDSCHYARGPPQFCNSALNKKNRINQLRNYIRYSGYGEPVVTVTSASKSDQLRLARLLHRMRRNCSPQRQERLRLKARLDYEMSLMRAVSFCEQQEQIYFRSASVDMENTDLQMLEDDLKYQALQEMRRNARTMEDVGTGNMHGNTSRARNHNSHRFRQSEDISGICKEQHLGENEEVRAQETLSRKQTSQTRTNTLSGSFGYEGDIMSGLLGSPLSKREMQDRIQSWLTGVEKAMTASHSDPASHYNQEHL